MLRAFAPIALALILSASAATASVVEYSDHAAFVTASGPLSVFGFDELTEGALLSGAEYPQFSLSAHRLTVLNPQDFGPGLSVGGANVNSQPQGISASIFYSSPNIIAFDESPDAYEFTLNMPVTSAGLWLGNLGAFDGDNVTPTQATFYDAQNNVLASETLFQGHVGMLGSGVNNRIFYGLTSDTPIARVAINNGPNDGDGIILDDFQYSTPEPSTAALLAFGVAAAAFLFRRVQWPTRARSSAGSANFVGYRDGLR